MSSPTRRTRSLLAAVAAAAGLAGCSLGGDGRTVTAARDVPGFTRIDSQDSVDVRLQVGGAQRVEVRAGEKVVDVVGLDVEDGTLTVTFDHDHLFGDEVEVRARVPRLDAVVLDGSGDMEVSGIAGDRLQLRVDGSGDVEPAGSVDQLDVDLDGSGDADLTGLAAAAARVVATGSGDVTLRADDQLAVTLDGSGDVRYHGDPAVTPRVDGSGDLTHAG